MMKKKEALKIVKAVHQVKRAKIARVLVREAVLAKRAWF